MDMLALAGNVTLALGAVLGLMWLLARMSRKPLKARAAGPLAVLARQQLSRSSSVAVVRVGDKALVIGVTDTQVSLLGEADLTAMTDALAPVESVSRTPVDLTAGAGVVGAGVVGPDDIAANEATDSDLAAVTDLGTRRAGAFSGSALSPATWKQTVDFLRERTARRQ
jgi:flagellar protein FliO/FliZ